MAVDRLVGVDHTAPRLPQTVITASVGTAPTDLAAGDTLATAKAYTDATIAALPPSDGGMTEAEADARYWQAWSGTQAAFDALGTYDDGTLYVVTEDGTGPFVVSPGGGGGGATAAATTTTITSTEADHSSVGGDIVTFTATVPSAVAIITSGTVTFYDGTTPLITRPVDSTGKAAFLTSGLPDGAHTISAHFNGTDLFSPSVSPDLPHTVIPAPPPDPGDTAWRAAFDTGDISVITSWFNTNTGHLAAGFDPANLWTDTTSSPVGRCNINAAWLTAHAAAGKVVNDSGSHWTITGLHCRSMRIGVSNLTFNHCFVDRQGVETDFHHCVEIIDLTTGSTASVPFTNFQFNFCTVDGGGGGVDDTDYGDGFTFDPDSDEANQFIIDHCEITDVRAGFLANFGVTARYTWVHDLDIFGPDPHNTSLSMRGRNCLYERNLLTDGTSACVSLYADFYPFTNLTLSENVFRVDITHATYEVLFPTRGTGFSPVEPGFSRKLRYNKFERGKIEFAYWTDTSGNTLMNGEPVLAHAMDPVPGEPTIRSGMDTELLSAGATPDMRSLWFTPSANSTLLAWHVLGQNGFGSGTPARTVTDVNGGTWTLVPGCSSPLENGPGDLVQYGMTMALYKYETGPAPQLMNVDVDGYADASGGLHALYVFELTGKTGVTLAKAAVISMAHNSAFGSGEVTTLTSGALASAATTGNLVCAFLAGRHYTVGPMGAAPSGWQMLGNNYDPVSFADTGEMVAAMLWRKDFTGTSLTFNHWNPNTQVVGMILCEFAVAL